MKYESKPSSNELKFKDFFIRNYIKLFTLMLPATFVLLLFPSINDNCYSISYFCKILFQQTMLNDLVYNILQPTPGAYWYFGLTLEFYLIYWLACRKKTPFLIISLVAFSIIAQIICSEKILPRGNEFILLYIRHNFIGWLLVFVIGIYYGRLNRSVSYSVNTIIVFLIALFVFCFSQFNGILWQLSPIASVFIVLAIAKTISKMEAGNKLMAYIGSISAIIYIVHPIIRNIMFRWALADEKPYFEMVIYMCVVLLASIIIDKIKLYFVISNYIVKWLKL